jgi:hypothetical protein
MQKSWRRLIFVKYWKSVKCAGFCPKRRFLAYFSLKRLNLGTIACSMPFLSYRPHLVKFVLLGISTCRTLGFLLFWPFLLKVAKIEVNSQNGLFWSKANFSGKYLFYVFYVFWIKNRKTRFLYKNRKNRVFVKRRATLKNICIFIFLHFKTLFGCILLFFYIFFRSGFADLIWKNKTLPP